MSSLSRSRLALLALSLSASLMLTACIVAPERGPGGPPEAVVERAPPAEIIETPPPPPGPREIWVWQKGHWHYDNVNYRWVPGRWVERPAYAHEWIPAHWDPRPNGYVFVAGHWQ